ncbi:MAG: tRNA (adenosine(37)-N6)-dimethylallyltransferase MiaA [Candidatus Gastranaerophilales bacterium]|nr:tRNA (adenosine(37)-N6)-dimethylallyltransferase MiaA [Candidatus Gastranaerophilales bacterium]
MNKIKKTFPLIVVTGPTASGKTTLAINLAKKIGAEIVCADSRIVYKGLDIVSAKPSFVEREGILHYLIDIKEPIGEPYSAGDFCLDAKKCIEKIRERGKPVIITGGTWFYIKCLLDENELLPVSSDKKLREELETLDNITLWQILEKLDKKRAEEIHPNNKERVIRAVEMVKTLGKEVSDTDRALNSEYNALWFAPDYIKEEKRDELYKRIDLRVDEMIKAGLYYEWERMKGIYGRTKVLENTIGYNEFFELEDGLYSNIQEAFDKIKQRTRNFAKRQLTFFRGEEKIITVKNEDEVLGYLNAAKI